MPQGGPGVPHTPRESRLLSEFLAAHYPRARIQLQPRLGQVKPELGGEIMTWSELRMLGVWRRYPDAILLLHNRVIVIEASLKPNPGKISLLQLYGRLFPQTEEFRPFWNFPVELLLVWAMPDVATEALARASGVRVAVYQPPWVLEWLQTLRFRDRRPPQTTA